MASIYTKLSGKAQLPSALAAPLAKLIVRRPVGCQPPVAYHRFVYRDHALYCDRAQPPVEAIANQGTPLPLQPKMKKITHITRNRKNKTFAIPADAAATPPNPNTAATSAIIKKVTAQPNIVSPPLAMNRIRHLTRVCL